MKLIEAKEDISYLFMGACSEELERELVAKGLLKSTEFKVIRNQDKMPVLIYLNEELESINRKKAALIEVEEAF
ncbi:MAG: ferrous iron transport protein A [Lachnospiraceae bacterium]|nr:ferrous iron transport protein A [Lachnospiraceae bacterium]